MRLPFPSALVAPLPLLALASPVPAAAQPAASAAWQVDYGAQSCTLSRKTEGEAPITYAVTSRPGAGSVALVMVGPEAKLPSLDVSRPAWVVTAPGGQRLEAKAESGNTAVAGERFVRLYLPAEFLGRLAEAKEVRVEGGPAPVVIPIPAAAKAVAAMNACTEDLAAEWGIDTKALASLRERPKAKGYFVGPEDYPADISGERPSGTVLVLLTISAEGRVSNCKVVGSSGSSLLDEATCRLALKNGRYEPAIGADGKATAASILFPVNWIVPK